MTARRQKYMKIPRQTPRRQEEIQTHTHIPTHTHTCTKSQSTWLSPGLLLLLKTVVNIDSRPYPEELRDH